jgi:hypothetical protein
MSELAKLKAISVQLIAEVWHYQNALSALETLQRPRHARSRKAVRIFFAEAASVEFFPKC